MGLFSSKTRTTVATSISRVITDAAVPNAIRSGIIKGILSGDQLVEHILEDLVASVGVRAGRMYRYGADGYVYGNPSGTLLSSSDGAGAVESLLKTQLGASLEVSYSHFGPQNNLHYGWKTLVESHGYDSATNQLDALSAIKGYPVYLKDMVAVVTDATIEELGNGSLDQWGISPNAGYTPDRPVSVGSLKKPTPFLVNRAAGQDYLEVTYVWQIPTNVVVQGVTIVRQVTQQESFTLQVPNQGPTAGTASLTGFYWQSTYEAPDFFQVKYSVNGKDGYWSYELGLGTYPAVDNSFSTQQSAQGTYFPTTYFRYGKNSMGGNPDSASQKSAAKLTKYLGMDFQTVVDGVHQNPGIADVEQAMMMMAVPANTSNAVEQTYLFDFFDSLYQDAGSSTIEGSIASGGVSNFLGSFRQPKISLVIQDSLFKTAVSADAIVKRRKAGVLGPVGTHASGRDTVTVVNEGNSIGPDSGLLSVVSWNSQLTYHYYRRQISDTLYDEIQVTGLRMTYYIYGGYNTVGDETDDILLIPLDQSITSTYGIPDREELYARSLHYIFNSRVVTKTKWYQSGFFQAILIVVAIILAAPSMGASLAAIGGALAAGAFYTLMLELLILIVPILLTTLVVKIFVKVVGVKNAFIAALVVAAVAIYNGNVSESFRLFANQIPSAAQLLSISSNLSKGVQNAYGAEIQSIQEEMAQFNTEMDAQNQLLEDARALLEGNNRLSPFVIFGESPEDFYNRTVHSGNIGVAGIDMVSSYVDIALTLPKLTETL